MKEIKDVSIVVDFNQYRLSVPKGTRYITVDWVGNVQIWRNKPSISEGYWSNEEPGFVVLHVELDEDDASYTKIFSTEINAFLQY